MARRWIIAAIVALVVVVGAVTVALLLRDDGSDTAAPAPSSSIARSTTTTTPTTTGPSATTAPATTGAPAAATTTAAPPVTGSVPGPCGTATAAIRSAIDAGVAGAAAADIATCRLAASDPTYAAAQLAAKPGGQFAATTVILHGATGAWTIVATGGTNAGCGQVPQQVVVDLGQFCLGGAANAQ